MLETVQCFFAGLTQIFTITTFGLMMLGIAIGFAVGILPGLGGPTGCRHGCSIAILRRRRITQSQGEEGT